MPRILIHWDELPEERDGNLVSIAAFQYDTDTQAWLEESGVLEAWVYTTEGTRVMAFYQ